MTAAKPATTLWPMSAFIVPLEAAKPITTVLRLSNCRLHRHRVPARE